MERRREEKERDEPEAVTVLSVVPFPVEGPGDPEWEEW